MPNVALVERDGVVEVGDGDADVVDPAEHAVLLGAAGVGRPCGVAVLRWISWQPGVTPRSPGIWREPVMSGTPSVIVAGARTPMGRLLGSLKGFSGADLGGFAIKAALERAGVAPEQVDYVIMGQVLQAGAGQFPARQAAVKGGIPMTTPVADHQQGLPVRARRHRARRPADPRRRVRDRRRRRHGVDDQRAAPAAQVARGHKYGDVDARRLDGPTTGCLTPSTTVAMGSSTERSNDEHHAHPRGAGRVRGPLAPAAPPTAQKNGLFDDEIAPVEIPQRKGDPVVVSEDEGIRADTTVETLARLRPAFTKDGTITAGSASQISDGACAVVVMSKAKAEELGLTWLAEIGAHGVVAGPDATLHEQPANAIAKALRRARASRPADLDLVEINEAFAAVGIVSARELGVAEDKVNVNGGAIALGHPIGMAGPGSRCTSRSSSSGAAAGSARRRCAAAAARATP